MGHIALLCGAWLIAGSEPAENRVDQYGDPLPPGAVARLGTIRFRPDGEVYRFGFSADGKSIAAQGLIAGTWLAEIPSGKPLGRLEEKHGYALSFSFSADGKILATSISQKSITLWDAITLKKLRTFPSDGVNQVLLAPNGKSMVVGNSILQIDTGKLIRKFPGAIQQFSTDGKTLRTWDHKAGNQFWDVATGKLRCRLADEGGALRCYQFASDSASVFCGKDDGTIAVYEVASGRRLRQWQAHPGAVTTLAMSRDAKILASGAYIKRGFEDPHPKEDAGIRLWEPATGKLLRQIDNRRSISQIDISPDGKLLAANVLGAIHLWEIATGKLMSPLAAHTNWVVKLAFNQNGTQLLSTSWDGTARLWNSKTGKQLQVIDDAKESATSSISILTALSGDAAMVATADHDLAIWDAQTGKKQRTLKAPDTFSSLAISPKDRLVAVGSYSPTGMAKSQVTLWDPLDGRQVRALQGDLQEPQVLAFSPDGKSLATICYLRPNTPPGKRRAVRVWDVATGKELVELASQRGEAKSIAFSPDGKLLAAGFESGTLRVWDVASGKQVRSIIADSTATNAVQFLPDNKTLLSAGISDAVHFHDVTTGDTLGRFAGPQGLLMTIAVSPDGKLLATGSTDSTVLLWEMAYVRKSLKK